MALMEDDEPSLQFIGRAKDEKCHGLHDKILNFPNLKKNLYIHPFCKYLSNCCSQNRVLGAL